MHIGQRGKKGGVKEEKGFKSVRMLLLNNFNERNSFSMSSITQDMKYRQSLVVFAIRYGAGRASKYNRARSYVYFWLNRYDGTLESLACRSRRPHSHPNQHTEQEIALLQNMCRRNPRLGRVGMVQIKKTRLYKVIERPVSHPPQLHLQPKPKKKVYKPKPYQQMTHPGERVQIDVKIVQRPVRWVLQPVSAWYNTRP